MTFEYYDAWLLEAIAFSENNGASLTDIVRAADYINHAIITYPELESGIKKLKYAGVLTEENKRLHTTGPFKDWWTGKQEQKKRINVLQAVDDIKEYLNKHHESTTEVTVEIGTDITGADLVAAINEYHNSFSIDHPKKKVR